MNHIRLNQIQRSFFFISQHSMKLKPLNYIQKASKPLRRKKRRGRESRTSGGTQTCAQATIAVIMLKGFAGDAATLAITEIFFKRKTSREPSWGDYSCPSQHKRAPSELQVTLPPVLYTHSSQLIPACIVKQVFHHKAEEGSFSSN